MRPGSIVSLDRIKLYYPYFRGKDGKRSSLLMEAEWLIAYLLLCDVLVIPPREFILQPKLPENLNMVIRNSMLQHLFQTGQIVTASPRTTVRDFSDLLEYYHPASAHPFRQIDLMIYDRDEFYQRRVYTDHLIKHIELAKYCGESDKKAFISFLGARPNHPAVFQMIDSLAEELDANVIERLRLEALDSYFLAGALGNGAIMPPSLKNERSLIYNPFYSKSAIYNFKSQFEKMVRGNIQFCSPDIFLAAKKNLSVFRYRYYQLSEKYQLMYERIMKLVAAGQDRLKFPLIAIFAASAVAVSSVLGPLLSMKCVTETVGASIIITYLWKFLDKLLKITDRLAKSIIRLLERLGLFSEYKSDVIALMDEFQTSIRTIVVSSS